MAIPLSGTRAPILRQTSAKRSRSSARSIASTEVPRTGAPSSSSPRARFRGVCPPSWTITPLGCSRWRISSTSSSVSGSKYSLSETSKSVDTVSGFEFTMIVSNPASRSASAACTQQ